MGLAGSTDTSAPRMREQASGIDALYMSGHGTVSPALLLDLERAKQLARDTGRPTPLAVGDCVAEVEAAPLKKYPYRIATPHGYVGVTDSERLPPVRIEPFAEHLHGVGPRASVAWFRDLAGSFTAGLRLTAIRLDVFSDWQGWAPAAEDRYRFVGRSTKRVTREESDAWSGFEFGRRSAGTLLARIYDKTLEAEAKGGSYWPAVWSERGDQYRPGESVTRVEVEALRNGLREHGIESVEDALDLAPAMWATATSDWLSLRQPTSDKTRSRWPVDPVWLQVQNSTFAQGACGLERLRAARGVSTMRSIRPGLVGYMSTAAALFGVNTVEDLVGPLVAMSRDYELVSGTSFADRVEAKRRKLRLAS